MTPRQAKFVSEYVKLPNATRAAIKAGYAKKAANREGSRLLSNVVIKSAIEAAQAQLAAKSGITAQRVLEELSRIAFADLRGLFDDDGKLKPIHELPEDLARALAGVEVTRERTIRKGEDETTSEYVSKVRSWDKPKTLELVMKHLGMLKEKVEHSGEIATSVRVIHEHHPA